MRKRTNKLLIRRFSICSVLAVALISLNVAAWGTLTAYTIEGEIRVCHYTDGGRMSIKSRQLCPADNSMDLTIPTSLLISTKEKESKRYCNYSNGSQRIVDMTASCPESND